MDLFGRVTTEGPAPTLWHMAFENGTFTGTIYNGTLTDRQRHSTCSGGAYEDERVLLAAAGVQFISFELQEGAVASVLLPTELVLASASPANAARPGATPASYLGPNPYVHASGVPDVTTRFEQHARAFPVETFLAVPTSTFMSAEPGTIRIELGAVRASQAGQSATYRSDTTQETISCPSPFPLEPTQRSVNVVHSLELSVRTGLYSVRQGDLTPVLDYWRAKRGQDDPFAQGASPAPRGYWDRGDSATVSAAYGSYALPPTLITAQGLAIGVEGRAIFHDATGTVDQNGTLTNADRAEIGLSGLLMLRPESDQEGGRRMVTRLDGSVYDVDVSKAGTLDWKTLMLGASGGALILGAAIAGWPAFRWRFTQLLLFPLYARLKREDILENPLRDDILQAVQEQPGISASELGRRLECGWGTLVYHLTVLERMRLVSSAREGRHKRFFAQGRINYSDKGAIALLANPAARNLLDAIRAQPGIIQKDLGSHLDLAPGTISWHVDRLAAEGLIVKEEDGRVVRYFPSERLLELTRRLAA